MDTLETLRNIATIVSLVLTLPVVLLSLGVLFYWGPQAIKHFREREAEGGISSVGWLIIGVATGFLGSAFDNLYWGIAWAADYINHSGQLRKSMFDNGVISNVPFRQICGVMAGYCHLRAALETRQPGGYKLLFWLAVVSGVLTLLTLLFI